MESISGHTFFSSWSGGKDSCLALYHALHNGGIPKQLLTMMTEDGHISRSHGIPQILLKQQAKHLNINITFRSATWNQYEMTFLSALKEFRSNGIEFGVFGDIDIESHRDWGINICNKSNLIPVHPLWKHSRKALLNEFIQLGFKAFIVVINSSKLGPEWLGRMIDIDSIKELESSGIDASGENGEYHTFVTGGPIFKSEIIIRKKAPVLHNGYWFLPLN